MTDHGIEIFDISKNFDNIKALDSINLKIPKGQIVGLLGQNGAGKSTLVRLLSGVMKPSGGTAKINGFDLKTQVNDVKRITGLLPEEYAFYEKLSIFEYIEFLGTLYDMDVSTIKERFDSLAEQLDIYDIRNRLIDTLSKGQKQKVAIIASIIHQPKILFLDEPLANLDVAAQRTVRGMIKEYKAQNRIILIATHLLTNVDAICDYIVIIKNGKIRFQGTIDDFHVDGLDLEESYLKYIESG